MNKENNKVILLHKQTFKSFLVDRSKDFHSNFGMIKKEQLENAKPGDILKTNTNKELIVINPEFSDLYDKIKRRAQIIPKKDIGLILANTLIGKDDICIDAGSGTGALAIALARYCKKVFSLDIREDHQEIAKSNAEFLGIKNIEFLIGDIYDANFVASKLKGIKASLLTLDVPEPWQAIDTAKAVLKTGGFIAVYTPTIIQNSDFVNELRNHEEFIHIKTVNVMEQQWEIEGRKIRPKSWSIYHSGFISLARKIR